MNTIKTVLLLGLLTGILLAAGELIGSRGGLYIALVIAAGLNFAGWFFSDTIALKAHRAQPVSEAEAPELYSIVHELTAAARLPMPRLYIVPEQQPNAFATGRNPEHAAVAVTQGLLQAMSRDELKGVLAHELAHVKHRDILISSVAATLAGAIAVIARMLGWALMFGGAGGRDSRGGGALGGLVFMIVAPIAALMIQMAVSRSREFAADAGGAEIAGTPDGLASALEKLGALSQRIPMRTARPTTAHMMIANPLRGAGIAALFTTHPPMDERIARLRAMRGGQPGQR